MKTLQPIEHTMLADKVYEILRDCLVRRQFAPGERLSTRSLAASLGVSVAPVKVAMDRLAQEGLLTITPRRGTIVTPLSREDIEDLFEIRMGLESLAVELACARATPDDYAVLRTVHEELRQAARQDDSDPEFLIRVIGIDYEFHLRIVQAAHSKRLLAAYESLNISCQIVSYSLLANDGGYKTIMRAHDPILVALEQRDVEATKEALRNHLRESVRGKLKAIESLAGERLGL